MAECGWKRRAPAAACVTVIASLSMLSGVPPSAHADPEPAETQEPGGTADAGEQEVPPLDIAILVDESGSLTDEDVAEEVNAASTIAQAALSEETRVSVVGFGSDNGESGQEAAAVRCEPTVVGEDLGRQYLAECVSDLRRRPPEEGHDTDHAAALSRALRLLDDGDSPEDAARVVFLLTDGLLDVEDSPHWGEPGERDEAALREIEDVLLPEARELGAQIWPLGFGVELNDTANREEGQRLLDAFAEGGSQETCNDLDTAQPQARIVDSSADVVRSLHEASAAATCSGLSDPDSAALGGGDSIELTVDIPVIATDGAILVTKNNPQISVAYRDPNGEEVPTSGEHDGSEFERSGDNSTVEALQIRDPRPGEWTVELTSPPGAAEELVTAVAQWQGAISTRLVVDGTGRTGEEVTARLTLWTRRTAIDDPDALAGLDFATTVEGGGMEPTELDLVADDDVIGQFNAQLATPDTEGELTFTSTVQGEGVAADEREFHYPFSPGGNPLFASVDLDPVEEAWPGRPVTGTVAVSNDSGAEADLRLVLAEPQAADARVDPPALEGLAPGQHEVDFEVDFGEDSPRGQTTVAVEAVDAAGNVVGASQPLTVTVRDAPGPLERFWWAWALMAALLVLAVVNALVRRSRYRARADVRGLSVALYRGDEQQKPLLHALSGWSDELRFVIRGEDTDAPSLSHAASAKGAYTLRRDRAGSGLQLREPTGERHDLRPGGPAVQLRCGLAVAAREERPRPSSPADRADPAPGPDTPPSYRESKGSDIDLDERMPPAT